MRESRLIDKVKLKDIIKIGVTVILIITVVYLSKSPTSLFSNKDPLLEYDYLSQWTSSTDPGKSCGLSVITNTVNYKNNSLLTLDQVRDKYPPDYKGYYTMERVGEALTEYNVEYEKVDLLEDYTHLFKNHAIVMCIDNRYITHNLSPTKNINKGYNKNFKHFVIAISSYKKNGNTYITVYDPYEKGISIRNYDKRQLDDAIINNSNYGYSILK